MRSKTPIPETSLGSVEGTNKKKGIAIVEEHLGSLPIMKSKRGSVELQKSRRESQILQTASSLPEEDEDAAVLVLPEKDETKEEELNQATTTTLVVPSSPPTSPKGDSVPSPPSTPEPPLSEVIGVEVAIRGVLPLHAAVLAISKSPPASLPYEKFMWAKEHLPKWKREGGEKSIGFYKIGREIGAGNFAKVKLGVHELLKEKVAIKIMDKSTDPKLEKMLNREISVLESLSHPNLIRLFEVCETDEKLYLISEWAPGGDLRAKIKLHRRLTESQTRPIFRQILVGVSFIHANGFVHRDLKADNILFSSPTHVKVGDFGLATYAKKGQMLMTFCGSPPYSAPELFRDVSYEGPPVDIWALGILLYYMVTGTRPFNGSNLPFLKKSILSGKYTMPENVTDEFKDLLKSILDQKPSRRATLEDIIHHPWLRSSNSEGPGKTVTLALQNRIELKKQVQVAIPSQEQIDLGAVSSEEAAAIGILRELGLRMDTIEKFRDGGIRSHVSGIYRIVLHRLLRSEGWDGKPALDHAPLFSNRLLTSSKSSDSLLFSVARARAKKLMKTQTELEFGSIGSIGSQPENVKSNACNIL